MVWTTYWAPQPWNSTQGRWTPRVIWRPVGLAVGLCETWTLLVNSAHNLACSQNKAEAADWDGTGLWSVLHDYPSLCTGLSQHPVLHLWLFRTVPWKGEGCHCWEECSTAGDWAGSDLTQHLNRVGQPWLALLRTQAGSGLKLWPVCQNCPQARAWPTAGTHSSPTWSITAPFWGEVTDAEKR